MPAAGAALLRARPDNPTLASGDSTPLRAVRQEGGTQVAAAVRWSSLDGGSVTTSVSDSGPVTRFTATEAGSYRLVAASPSFSLADTTQVTVASAAVTATITTLVMRPATRSIGTNDTLRFAVWGLTASGDSVPAPVHLYPDHGYVRGLDYFCPIEGTFRIRAILDGTSITTEAHVTVGGSASGSDSEPTGNTSSGNVVRLEMSPTFDTIPPNDTLKFTVRGVTSSGERVPVDVVLAPDRGYVRGLSYFTPIEGTFRIRALQRDGTLADTAWITVKNGAPAAGGTTTPEADDPIVPTVPPSSVNDDPSEPTSPTDPPISSDPIATPPSPAEKPRVLLDTRFVEPTGRTIQVPAGGDLQAAINGAARGDVIELAAGASYVGNFYLTPKSGTGWVTIRTATTLPPEGTRVTPSSAASFAKLVTPNSMPALVTSSSAQASGYRVMGVELKSSASMTFAIAFLGDEKALTRNAADLPGNIILDRVWIHGGDNQVIQRCLVLNDRSSAIIDSRLSGCHLKGGDSQAIIGWSGPGPFKIVNNYVEGAGENIMFGGGDPYIQGLIPSDIEIRGNHIMKPLAWQSSGAWSVKNSLELKNAQRVLVQGNVIENNWFDAQTGFMIVLASVNQSGSCTWCVVRDVTIESNRLINSPGGINMAKGNQGSQPTTNLTIRNNIFERIAQDDQPGARRALQYLNAVANVTIAHNTITGEGMALLFDGERLPGRGFVFRDNLVNRGQYGIIGSSVGEGTTALNAYVDGWVFTRNVIVGGNQGIYPEGNYFPGSYLTAGLSNVLGGVFELLTGSPYVTAATDGTAIGADVDEVMSLTNGVR